MPAFAFAFLQSVMAPLLLATEERFDSSPSATSWVLTSFLLVSAATTAIGGRLGGIKGSKRVLLWALGALMVGLATSAFAPTLEVLVAGRTLQGTSAAIFPLVVVLLREHLPAPSVVPAVGSFTATTTGGAAVGLVLAGPVTEHLGYAWVFLVPLILTAVSVAILTLVVPEAGTVAPGRIEYVGALLLVAWITAILLAAAEGGRWGWTSPATLVCAAAVLPLVTVWLLVERNSPSPMISPRILRTDGVWQANMTTFFFGAALFGVFAFVPVVLQSAPGATGSGLGASLAESGLLSLPMPMCMFAFGACAGPIIRRIGPRVPVIGGSAILVLSLVALLGLHTQRWHFVVVCAALGVGFGLGQSAITALVIASVSPADTGAAVGMNANIRIVGGTLGIQATLLALNASASDGGQRTATSFWAALVLLLVAAALTAVTSLLLPRTCGIRPATVVA